MTSAEPSRTVAYTPDIGWRVVWQRTGMGMTFEQIATRLQIAASTAHRIYTRFEATGDVAPSKQPQRPFCRKLDNLHELLIIGLIHENPGMYLREICAEVYEVTGVLVACSTHTQERIFKEETSKNSST